MKSFKFKYAPLVWILLIAVILLTAAGTAYSVFSTVDAIKVQSNKIFSSIIIAIVNLALLVFASSVAIFGKYTIKTGVLYSFFGFIRTKTQISEVVQITHFKKTDKLVLYFKDAKYTVIVISPTDYDAFIESLRQENSNIIFNATVDGENK